MSSLSLFGTSKAVELAEAADGTLTVAKTEAGIAKAVVAEIAGSLNGGKTFAIGFAKPLVTVGIAAVADSLAQKRINGSFGIPFGLF